MSRPIDPRLIRVVPSLRGLITTLAMAQVGAALLTVGQAGLLAATIAAVFEGHTGHLVALLCCLALTGLGRAGVAASQEWLTARASTQVRGELRGRVLAAVAQLGPRRASEETNGRLVAAAGPGLESLDGYVTRAIPALVSAGVVPFVVVVAIGILDWKSAVLLIIALPLVPLFMILVGKTTRRLMERRYAAMAALSGHFLDLIRGLPTLKIYGRAHSQIDTVRRASEAYRVQTLATLRVAFLSGLVLDLISTLSVAVVAVDIGLRLDDGHLGLRPALFVLLLAPELFGPLRALGTQHHASEEGRAAAAAALDLIDEGAAADPSEPLWTALPRRVRKLHFEAVTVAYPGRVSNALKGVALSIDAGQTVALQGRSGAGKSTLIDCLLRFVEPSSGRITLDTDTDTDIGSAELSAWSAAQWREQVAWVPQRPQPTQRTVGEEVALGHRGATAEQIAAVISACHAPHPDTALGEDGSAVSAGQRRRIALARALLRAQSCRDAGTMPLVLLDEPSEDLDRATELVIASVIGALRDRATVIMATHSSRLASLADQIVVLDNGRVVSSLRQRPTAVSVAELTPRLVPETAAPHAPPRTTEVDIVDRAKAAKSLAWAGTISGITGIAGLALTATSVWLICRAAQHPNVQALEVAVVGVRTFALARALLRYVERLVSHDRALRLLTEVRVRVFAALEPLVPAATGDLRRGDLLRRFINDVDGVQEGLVRAVIPLIGAGVTALAAIVVAGLVNPLAGGALAVGLIFGTCVVPLVVRRMAGRSAVQTASASARDTGTNALLDGLAELTAYGATGRAIEAVMDDDARVHAASRRAAQAAAIGVALTGAATAVTMPVVLALGAQAVNASGVQPIWVAVLAATVLGGFDALAPLPSAFAAWARFRAGFDRIVDLLATEPAFVEPAELTALATGDTGLRIEAVTIAPSPTSAPVLEGASLTVPVGHRVVITGASGSGKSTLLAAALRLLPTCHGEVELVCGSVSTALGAVRSAQMPPLVAGSLQGDHVFNASLRDNLKVVRPGANDGDLDRVARTAGLANFIGSLEDGWSTGAGPDGARLSGGQRQRLLLARALLADPDVLVLDEPTAHLDEDTEREVLRDVLRGTRGRTVLMSTHRLLSPDQVDSVLHLADGTLAETGS